MNTARVLLKQGDKLYRLARFVTSADGSLLVFFDRDPSPLLQPQSSDGRGGWVKAEANPNKNSSHAKFTIHTTGEVHYYPHAGGTRTSTFYIEPLYELRKTYAIGFISVPRVSTLDQIVEGKHRHAVAAVLDIPDDVTDRLTFALEVSSNPVAAVPDTYGVSLNYELYSAIVRLLPLLPIQIDAAMSEHFIVGAPTIGTFDERKIDKANAELNFYRRVHGQNFIVLREAGGAYVVLAARPMAKPPKIKIEFNRDDLYAEPIPFGVHSEPTHKARFWIYDKGGKNLRDDLRMHIKSVELDAEL